MSIHIANLTSEIRSLAPSADAGDDDDRDNRWEAPQRLGAHLARLDHRIRRTATGHGDD